MGGGVGHTGRSVTPSGAPPPWAEGLSQNENGFLARFLMASRSSPPLRRLPRIVGPSRIGDDDRNIQSKIRPVAHLRLAHRGGRDHPHELAVGSHICKIDRRCEIEPAQGGIRHFNGLWPGWRVSYDANRVAAICAMVHTTTLALLPN